MKYPSILQSRYKLIIKYTGMIIMIIAGALLLPLLVLINNPVEWVYGKYFLITAVLAFIPGYLLYFKIGHDQEKISLTLNEGGIIVILSWVMAIGFSTLPFLWGLRMNLNQAVFESVSGWTTTGLSVMDVSRTPDIYLMWRSIMQFLGGAGLAVIALSSILPMQGLGLYRAEGRTDQLLPHIRRSTKMIIQIYVGYTIAGIILYYLSGMNFFNAINHAFAALSTGGFSTVTNSIGHWDSIKVELVTIILMFLGTINFATHYTLLQGKFKKFFHNGEIKLMGLLLAIMLPLIIFSSLLGLYNNFAESLRQSSFQLISALSTTGFSTIDFNNWPVIANFMIILLMLIGGGAGSTAGGIKQFRIYIIIKSIYWEIKKQFNPRYQIEENYIWRGDDKWYVKSEQIKEIANYIFLYLLIYVIGVTIFLIYGYPLKDSLFEFASALGTVGLSVGITGASTPGIILWTEIFGMILGRLEILIIIFGIIKLINDGAYLYKQKE